MEKVVKEEKSEEEEIEKKDLIEKDKPKERLGNKKPWWKFW